jgi:hypothetical protein
MRWHLFRLAAAPAALVFASGAIAVPRLPAQSSAAAAIRGRVITQNEVPLPDVELTALGTTRTITTDAEGRFHLRGLDPGLTVLRVRRIGYKGQYLEVQLTPGSTRTVEIMLELGAYVLPDIKVSAHEAKPIEYAWTTKYDDFFRRRRLHSGTFFSREDIRRRSAMHTAELLQSVPGTRVRFGPYGMVSGIDFSRCSSGHIGVWVDGRKLNWQPSYQQAQGINLVGGNRPVTTEQAAKEAARQRQERTSLAEVLERVHPLEVEMMEVYRGIGNIPGEFSDAGCGAIVIWTR